MTSYVYTPSGPHTCSACSMGFSSSALLAKHQSRFCIGSGHDMVLVRNCKRCESRCHCHEEPMTERSRYNPNTDPKLQSLAENHGKQMEFLSNRNRDLERQRDEIRRRLGDLGRKPPEGDNTAALLAELRDQEARNQRLLDELKKQLLVSRQPVAIIGEQQQVQQKKSYTYPIYYGNSLVAEISAIRQAYIQSGGNDPEILAQLAQMLAEAQAIEDAMRNKKPPEPKQKEKKTEFSSHIMTMDMENERLNRELFLLQQQNTMAKGRRKDDREDELERELRRLQQDHLLKMYELQQQMECLRQDTIVDRTRLQLELNTQQQSQPQNIVIHQPPCPPSVVQQPMVQPMIQPVQQTKYVEVDRGHSHCYDSHQHCRCAPRKCPPPRPPPPPPPPPRPPSPPPPPRYIPLQLPPPPPIQAQELQGGRGGQGGQGGGGYSWYVEEYVPPQRVEEGEEPTEAYRIERRFGPNGEPIDGGPPMDMSKMGRGRGTPMRPMGDGGMGPMGGRGMGPIGGRGMGPMGGRGMGPMGGRPGPNFRLPTSYRPYPRYNNYNSNNDMWNGPIPGVDNGVQFDHY